MATDEFLLDRLRNILKTRGVSWNEKRMFGGDCFMVDEKMCFGTFRGGLMARVNPEKIEEYLEREGAEQMIHGGRKMTGYAFVHPEGYDMEEDLEFWIEKCIEWNPLAKASKKKKKKQ